LAGIGLSAFLGPISLGYDSTDGIVCSLVYGAIGLGCLAVAGVKWLRRRRGLRATSVGLSEVFGRDRERLYEWHEIEEVEERASATGRAFIVKTAGRKVRFDTSVEGWERLVACVRAGLTGRKPAGAAAMPDAESAEVEPERLDLAQLAPWLGDLPRTLRYPRSSYHKMVGIWVGALLVVFLISFRLVALAVALTHSFFNVVPLVLSLFLVFGSIFLGTSYSLRHAKRRAENACVTIAGDRITVVDTEGIEQRFAWREVLHVQGIQRKCTFFDESSAWVKVFPDPRAIQVRTPWGYFEIDQGLEEYDRLLELLQRIVVERGRPPDYPAARLMASDAALSRATAPTEPTPTAASLSRAEEPVEEQPRLAAAVTETESEPARVEVRVER
jgi:hypothetical protein